MRPKRKQRPTPKGEAARSLEHARELLKELEAIRQPDQKQLFAHRLNDFLRSARTVADFLPKESGRSQGFAKWVRAEIDKLHKFDTRFDYFCNLRRISEHDCLVEPDRADISVQIAAQLRLRGSMEAELRDASGKVLAKVSQAAPAGETSSVEQASIAMCYFFRDWPNEDIVSFCKGVVARLDDLIRRAYQQYP